VSIPDGYCNCEGIADVDGDGVCDNIDSCLGELDAVGTCNGDCTGDADADGICDDGGLDTCFGSFDLCGVCNGPGPVYECGCSDIPEGDCDCAGNLADEFGNCPDYLVDANNDAWGLRSWICMGTVMIWLQSVEGVGFLRICEQRSI
jgi:hypothetical protein